MTLLRDYPGGTVVKTLHLHSRGCGFNSGQGTRNLHAERGSQKNLSLSGMALLSKNKHMSICSY